MLLVDDLRKGRFSPIYRLGASKKWEFNRRKYKYGIWRSRPGSSSERISRYASKICAQSMSSDSIVSETLSHLSLSFQIWISPSTPKLKAEFSYHGSTSTTQTPLGKTHQVNTLYFLDLILPTYDKQSSGDRSHVRRHFHRGLAGGQQCLGSLPPHLLAIFPRATALLLGSQCFDAHV